jgi:hypothetical protein
VDEKVARLERCADDDVAGVELPGDEAAVVAPFEQAVAPASATPSSRPTTRRMSATRIAYMVARGAA